MANSGSATGWIDCGLLRPLSGDDGRRFQEMTVEPFEVAVHVVEQELGFFNPMTRYNSYVPWLLDDLRARLR